MEFILIPHSALAGFFYSLLWLRFQIITPWRFFFPHFSSPYVFNYACILLFGILAVWQKSSLYIHVYVFGGVREGGGGGEVLSIAPAVRWWMCLLFLQKSDCMARALVDYTISWLPRWKGKRYMVCACLLQVGWKWRILVTLSPPSLHNVASPHPSLSLSLSLSLAAATTGTLQSWWGGDRQWNAISWWIFAVAAKFMGLSFLYTAIVAFH